MDRVLQNTWNDLETAALLAARNADANAANDFRVTPLSEACTNGSAELVGLLIALFAYLAFRARSGG